MEKKRIAHFHRKVAENFRNTMVQHGLILAFLDQNYVFLLANFFLRY